MNAFLSAFSPVRNIKQLFIRPPGNFPVLDGFRALSMLMILVFHTFAIYCAVHPDVEMINMIEEGGLAWSWAWNADKSVDIFFVISGFLISGILLRQIDREKSADYLTQVHTYISDGRPQKTKRDSAKAKRLLGLVFRNIKISDKKIKNAVISFVPPRDISLSL